MGVSIYPIVPMAVKLIVDDAGFRFGKVRIQVLYRGFELYIFQINDLRHIGCIDVSVDSVRYIGYLAGITAVGIHFPKLPFGQVSNEFPIRCPSRVRFVVVGIGETGGLALRQIHQV